MKKEKEAGLVGSEIERMEDFRNVQHYQQTKHS
jgi:hypothetical protein